MLTSPVPAVILFLAGIIGLIWLLSGFGNRQSESPRKPESFSPKKRDEPASQGKHVPRTQVARDDDIEQDGSESIEDMHEIKVSIHAEYLTLPDIPDEVRTSLNELTKVIHKLPNAMIDILPVLSRPGTGAKEISRIIARDQAMAARILRWVNSSFYGLEGKITSLQHAVAILGMDTVRSFVLEDSFSRGARLKGIQGLSPEAIWRHAAAVSVVTKHLGHIVRGVEPEVAATAGLLHNIGLLLKLMLESRNLERAIISSNESCDLLIVHEQEISGYNHQALGECFAIAWRLPEEITDAIGRHHSPMKEPFIPLAGIIWLSDYVVSRIGFACPESQVPITDTDEIEELLDRIGLRPPLGQYIHESLVREVINATRYWPDKKTAPQP